MTPRRSSALLAGAVFLACLCAYLPTLNPAFRADDSPETMATAVTLGIQHPPAYPLQTLVGRLASLLPLGAPAWRLNLLAAVLGALACALAAALAHGLALEGLRERGESAALASAAALLAGAVAGVVLGYSGTFWSQALAAKGGIYTLHMALLAGALLALVAWSRAALSRPAASQSALLGLPSARAAVLLLGLGLANHWETQALMLPAAALLLLAGLWGRPRLDGRGAPAFWRAVAALLLLLATALAVYLYLPLRARLDPFLDWGDPRDWAQFRWVFMRQEYLDLETGFLKSLNAAAFGNGTWSAVGENWLVVQRQGLRVLRHLAGPHADLGLPWVLLSAAGLAWLRPRWRPWRGALGSRTGSGLVVMVAAFVGVVTFYFHLRQEMVWILDVFLLPVYLAQALLAGLGLLWLAKRWPPAWRPGVLVAAAAAALTLLPWSLYALRSAELTQARQFLAWDFGQDLLLSIKPHGIILAEGDFYTMPVYYLQQVRGLRPDVDHVTTVFLSTDWGAEHARAVQPRLGLGELPKAITGERAGDGHVLRTAVGQIAQANLPARPLFASHFRQVLAANVPEWEPGAAGPGGAQWTPSGLAVQLEPVGVPASAADEARRVGLLRAFRSRHLELNRLDLDPSPSFALSNYGTAFLETALYLRQHHRAKEALPLYAQAVQWTSRDNLAEAWTHYGIALAAGGDSLAPDLAGAGACFRKALEVKPLLEAWINLAGVENQLGQRDKNPAHFVAAEGAARQALTQAPGHAQAWNNLAIALYYQGRRDEAVAALRSAAQFNPQDPQIRGNLAAMGAGR